MFNWQSFLEQHRIPYTDKGRNVSHGNLALKCPFCGDKDPSMHMNVSLRGRGYACWRDVDHRGKNDAYLVHALIGVSLAEARQIVYGDANYIPTVDEFAEIVRRLERSERKVKKKLQIPDDWRPLWKETNSPLRSVVFNYLVGRKYPTHDAIAIAARYNLHYAIKAPWSRRVIFPIYDETGSIVNFTGRAVSSEARIRYKTLDRENAALHMSECLLDYHRLIRTQGEVLVVCEGPFDAMRLTWIGEPFGIHSTCVFTQNVSEVQAEKLLRLASNFKRRVVLFDRGAELHAMRALFSLVGYEKFDLPEYPKVKDPGDLTGGQALALCRSLLTIH